MTIKRGPGPGQQTALFVTNANGDRTTVRGLRAVLIRWLVSANYLDEPTYTVGKMELSWSNTNGLDVKVIRQERELWREEGQRD